MALDPPDFEIIAAWIRDEQWIDMRVCDVGLVERVLPQAVTLHRDWDQLHCCQEYILDEQIVSGERHFDCEDIMWWRESIFAIEDVTPQSLPTRREDISNERLAEEILETVAFLTGHGTQTIKDSGTCSHERQVCIRLMWEASTLGAGKIPQLFGYSSGGMFTSAMTRTGKHAEQIKRAYALLETRLGHRLPFIRSTQGTRGRQSPIAAVTS